MIADTNETGVSLVPEERMMFGVHAHAMYLMTVAKIRKVYNKTDAKSIAKQVALFDVVDKPVGSLRNGWLIAQN